MTPERAVIDPKAEARQSPSSGRGNTVYLSTERSEQKAVPGAPLDDEIRRHAYKLYELRGRTEGYALEDWFAAECYLRARNNRANKVIFR
jgi:hypothetical protein